MTVQHVTTIDQTARQDDGRLLLAMTEVRPYARGDAEALVEDFRRKLNTYVYAIRSGQLADSGADGAPPTGFDIVLFCPDEPVPLVQEMIATANSALTAESVTVRWRQLEELLTAAAAAASQERPLEKLSTEELVVALGQALVAELPPGWERPGTCRRLWSRAPRTICSCD